MKAVFAAVLAVVTVVPRQALEAQARGQGAPLCLALATGAWSPRTPGPVWSAARLVTLRPERERLMDMPGVPRQWRRVEVQRIDRTGRAASPNEYDRAWAWLALGSDSLRLVRPAMLSAGMSVVGSWRGDTLSGRANVFSDAIRFPQPRANAYGVRFACEEGGAAARALAAVRSLAGADVPNPRLAAREDSLAQAELRRLPNR